MGNPLADRTRVAGLTLADGTWVAIHSLGAGVVSIAMYGPMDGSADENATVQPDVVLGLSEREAQVLAPQRHAGSLPIRADVAGRFGRLTAMHLGGCTSARDQNH